MNSRYFSNLVIKINDTSLKEENEINFLGLNTDSSLDWKTHCKNLTKSVDVKFSAFYYDKDHQIFLGEKILYY